VNSSCGRDVAEPELRSRCSAIVPTVRLARQPQLRRRRRTRRRGPRTQPYRRGRPRRVRTPLLVTPWRPAYALPHLSPAVAL
jgi:hypothetical protein